MKTNNAFDPLNLSEIREFTVIPEYLHGHYSRETAAVYEWHAEMLRDAFGQSFRQYTDIDREPEALFVACPERGLGFWMPSRPDTFAVEVQSNGYQNPDMDAASFGMACTLMIVNHWGWFLAEDAEPGSARYNSAQQMSDLYLSLRDWAFDLSEQGLLDGEAIAGFID
jgi:hypothetical protein